MYTLKHKSLYTLSNSSISCNSGSALIALVLLSVETCLGVQDLSSSTFVISPSHLPSTISCSFNSTSSCDIVFVSLVFSVLFVVSITVSLVSGVRETNTNWRDNKLNTHYICIHI